MTLALAVLASSLIAQPQQAPLPPRPRLVVVFSIDQFRADNVARFADHYLPAKRGSTVGGFNWLATAGANYIDSHYDHIPTFTGPGHSVIMTGSTPALDGIVGNEWFDRSTGKEVYCVDDAGVATVGGNSGPMSAKNLHVSTVGDELKLATGGRGKVVGVSFKDRAAILMAGHAADAVIWFDGTTSNWVTSTYYAKTLPRWVQQVNAEKVPASTLGKSWTPLLPDSAYRETRLAPFVKGAAGSPIFSHKISNGGDFTASSYGQEYVFRTAERAVSEERLGQDDVPDVLCINLATNDYVGHAYGPDSPEVMDMAVRTDRLFSEFFEYLHNHVNGGLASTVIVVTADHGIAPIPEESNGTYRLGHVVRGRASALAAAVNKALAAKYGDGKYVQYCYPPHIYIDHSLLETRHADLAEAERVAAAAARSVSGIYEAFAGEDILTGQVPDWPWMREVANGYNRALSGDVMAFEVPGSIFAGGAGTTHGTPWAYDTHVPLMLFGPGVHAGTYSQRVSQCDIAPTLCRLLRIEQPSGSVGRLLVGALGG